MKESVNIHSMNTIINHDTLTCKQAKFIKNNGSPDNLQAFPEEVMVFTVDKSSKSVDPDRQTIHFTIGVVTIMHDIGQ